MAVTLEEVDAMKISRSDALAVCEALGLKAAKQWDNTKMASKMESFTDMKDVEKKVAAIKGKDIKNLAKAILTALENEKGVEVVDDEKPAKSAKKDKKAEKPAKKGKAAKESDDDDDDDDNDDEEEEESEDEDEEGDDDESEDEDEDEEESDDESDDDEDSDDEDEESEDEDESDEDEDEDESDEDEDEEDEEVEKPKKTGKKGKKGKDKPEKAEKAAKKGKTKKKSAVEKDVFGNRVDTRTSRINMALWEASKALTVGEIEKKAKAKSIHSHLHKLVGKGLAKKTKDGKYQKTGKKAK